MKLKIYWVGVEWGNNGLLSHRRNAEPVRFRPTQICSQVRILPHTILYGVLAQLVVANGR